MMETQRTLSAKWFFLFILIFLALTDLCVLLDVPILRPFLGFLFFSIIPGLLIIFSLKLNKLGLTEQFVLSVGLSVAFLIFAGLIINSVYPLLGYATPLSTGSVVISFSIILIILAIIGYIRNQDFLFALSGLKFDTSEKAFLLLPALLLLLSILGMRLMNTNGNNTILLILLSLIPAYVIFIAAIHKRVSERIYPTVILFIGLSVVFLISLRSNYIIGRDTHWEYYFFQLTSNNQHWQVVWGTTLDACLSINLLPTIYQSFMNINPEYLFKILYPILLSVLPLSIYIVARKYIGTLYAFLASFFLISQLYFLWTAALARINLAVLFFILAVTILFHDGIPKVTQRCLFIIFAASCIVSHYSTTYITFFILLLTWLVMKIVSGILSSGKKATSPPGSHTPERSLSTNKANVSRGMGLASSVESKITLTAVALFFVMLFFWYSQVTGAPFSSGVNFIARSFISLQNIFVTESREPLLSQALGLELGYSEIPARLKFVFNWLTIAFIAAGILIMLVRHLRTLYTTSTLDKLDFLQYKIDIEYLVISLVCCAILVLSLVFPYVGVSYGIARVYFQMMGILAMFFIIGGITIAEFPKLKASWLILLVMIPFFICNTGLVDKMFRQPTLILDSRGSEYAGYYIHDQEAYAASWLRSKGELENTKIYADDLGSDWLISLAGVYPWCDARSLFLKDADVDGYIYLRYDNVVNGKLISPQGKQYSLAECQDKFIGKAKIYDNAGSQIYR